MEILNAQEAADFLKVKKSTIYQLHSRKEIPAHRVGGKLVFFKDELIEWVKSNNA